MLSLLKQIISHKVVQSSGWYTISNFFLQGLSFLTIPIFTRLLTTEDYGIASLISVYVSIASSLITLGLGNSVQLGKFEYGKEFNKFLSSVAFLSLISFSISLVFVYSFSSQICNLLQINKLILYFIIIVAYFTFLKEFLFSKYVIEYVFKGISILNILIGILSIILSIYLIKYIFISNGYYGKIIGSNAPQAITGIIACGIIFIKGRSFINIKHWKTALIVSIPFVFHNISNVIYSQFDRVLINKYLGASQTGLYSFAYNVGTIILVVWVSANSAFNPFFFEKMESKEYNLLKSISKDFRNIFTLIYVFILFFTPELVRIMANENYWPALNIVPWIFLALFFQMLISFESKIEYAYKKTFLTPIGSVLAGITNIFLNIILIPKYGVQAAAIATVISYVLLFIYHYVVTKYIIKISFFGLRFHLIAIFAATSATILFFIFRDNLLARVIIILIYILYYGNNVYKRYINRAI